jgi:nucleotide-binding universal stress UspA family protein
MVTAAVPGKEAAVSPAPGGPPVVVGIDGSQAALTALDWAAAEAARGGWPLLLVNAVEDYALELATPRVAHPVTETVFGEAWQRLESSGYAGLQVTTVARRGSPRRVLLRAATGGRMLVLGRKGTGQFAELMLGSSALACATHAKVPVVVVPPGWQPLGHRPPVITAGVDGSAHSRTALEYAFATATRWQGRLVAVLATRTTAEPAAATEAAARLLSEQLADWRAAFPDVPVTEVVAPGHPAAAIKQHAADADLVVVGSRGHGAVTGMLLGSVAQALLHHLDRPIAIVHTPAPGRSRAGARRG